MPRPKGSKNKKSAVVVESNVSVEELNEKIAAAEAEIERMTAGLKDKKAELKALVKEKDKAEKREAKKRTEEDKARILDAVAASGKSVDEIIELLK